MITNTELIRRDLAATNHDIVLKVETPLAKTWKAKDETAEKTEAEGAAQAQAPAAQISRDETRNYRRRYSGRHWRRYAAVDAGGNAAK